jgi:hypothetical protein
MIARAAIMTLLLLGPAAARAACPDAAELGAY